ncbi:MAG: phosphoenolpyruvate carboxylase [Alphaproteobacteria bacterium]|nr:phosphoenolpyruvate carboxylase [Alphaproteobacteria bacterium]
MLDGISNEDLRSYYQARTAKAFIAPILQHLVPEEDADLIPDLEVIADELITPVIDSSVYSAHEFADANFLNTLYGMEKAVEARRHGVFDSVFQKYKNEPARLRRVMEHVVFIGQVIKVAAPHSHDNVVEDARPERDRAFDFIVQHGRGTADFSTIIPEGLEHYLSEIIRIGEITNGAEMRAALATPVITSVSTSHPTRYTTSAFTDARRVFALAQREMTRRVNAGETHLLLDYMNGRGEAFEALQRMKEADLTFKDDDGNLANLTPLGEIMASLADITDDFTRNIDEIYRKNDNAMQRLSDAKILPYEYDAQERLLTELSLRFATWVMGDKDGNNNIRSEHLLLATALFRHKASELYAQQLNDSGLVVDGAPDGGTWNDYLAAKNAEMADIIEPLLKRIAGAGNGVDLPLSREEYEGALTAIKNVYAFDGGNINEVNAKFQQSLTAAYHTTQGAQQKAALSLIRKSKMLGLGLLNFHLRETAEVYEPVMATLLNGNETLFGYKIEDYAGLEDAQKLALLNSALGKGGDVLGKLKTDFFARLKSEGKTADTMRNYSKHDADVITLHTLQRFEVGGMQDGLITDHVLAECQGALQMMETLLVSKMTGVNMVIVPLLEDIETLTQAVPIFEDVFKQRAWRDHMWEMAQGDPTRIVNLLKIQFAHSDCMRRGGLPRARSNIYDQANLLVPGMKELFPKILQAYVRDGRIQAKDVSGILKQMNERPTAYHVRQFHGGSKSDTARGGVRSTTAFNKDANLADWMEDTHQGGDNPELRLCERFQRLQTTLVARNALELVKKSKGNGASWNYGREHALNDAIDNSIEDYLENHYGAQNQLGKAMGEVGFYDVNHTLNNPGSRQGRSETGGIKAVYPNTKPVAPGDMRTIGFTTTGLDMGVGFAVLPMRNMAKYINQLYGTRPDLRAELLRDAQQAFGDDVVIFENDALTPKGLQTLYKVSPIYRAAVADFPAFGVAISNVQFTVDLLKQREERGAPKVSIETMDYFTKSLPLDIVGAAVPYLQAKGVEIPEGFISKDELANPNPETCSKLSFLIRKITMQHIDEQMGMGARMQDFSRIARETLYIKAMETPDQPYSKDAEYMFRLAGIARGLSGHQIYDGASDHSMGVRRVEKRAQREHWAPALAAA